MPNGRLCSAEQGSGQAVAPGEVAQGGALGRRKAVREMEANEEICLPEKIERLLDCGYLIDLRKGFNYYGIHIYDGASLEKHMRPIYSLHGDTAEKAISGVYNYITTHFKRRFRKYGEFRRSAI